MMKNKIAWLVALAALLVAAPAAMAQDDDDGLFGDDPENPVTDEPTDTTDSPAIEGSDNTTTDTNTNAGADTGAAAGGEHKLGVGFSTTVLGAGPALGNGAMDIEFWLSDKLVANGIARLVFVSPDPGDSILGINVGAGALYVLRRHGPAMLMLGGRFLLGYLGGDNSTTSVAIEVPLRLEMKLAERLSAHVEGGVGIGISDQLALGGGPDQDFNLLIGSRNVFGNAGLSVYF